MNENNIIGKYLLNERDVNGQFVISFEFESLFQIEIALNLREIRIPIYLKKEESVINNGNNNSNNLLQQYFKNSFNVKNSFKVKK